MTSSGGTQLKLLKVLAKLLLSCIVGFEGAEGTCWEGTTSLAGLLKSFSSNSLNTLEKLLPDVGTIVEELLGLDGATFEVLQEVVPSASEEAAAGARLYGTN